MSLFTTDFRYLTIPLLLIIGLTAVLYYRHWKASAKPQPDNQPLHVYDFKFRDDKGNVFHVTAADTYDAFELLREDHELSTAYIARNVWLAEVKEVF